MNTIRPLQSRERIREWIVLCNTRRLQQFLDYQTHWEVSLKGINPVHLQEQNQEMNPGDIHPSFLRSMCLEKGYKLF